MYTSTYLCVCTHVLTYIKETWDEPPPFVLTSSARNYGKEELLRYMSEMIHMFRDSNGALSVGESDAMESENAGFSLDVEDDDESRGEYAGAARAPDTKTALPWIQRTLTAERKKKKKEATIATTMGQRSRKKSSTPRTRRKR